MKLRLCDVLNATCADYIAIKDAANRRDILAGDCVHVRMNAPAMGLLNRDVLAIEPLGKRVLELRIDY